MLGLARHSRRRSRFARYGLACAAVVLASALEFTVAQTTGSRYLFIALSPAVAFAAWYGGFGPGALAVLLSLVATFLSEPLTVLQVRSHPDLIALATFTGCWLAVSLLAESVYRHLRHEGLSRVEAERIAGQADRLQQFTAAVNDAKTSVEAAEACVQEALYATGADAGALLRFADDTRTLEVARAVGYTADAPSRWPDVIARVRNPVSDAARTRRPVVFESRRARTEEYPAAGVLFAASHQAGVALPLTTGGRVIGVLRLDFDAARPIDTDDRQFLLAIAPRAAHALDRIGHFEAAERARAEAERERTRADDELAERQRIEQALRASETRYRALAARTGRLHGLSAALSVAVTVDAVARALAHHGRIVAGATRARVSALVDGVALETLFSEDGVSEVAGHGDRVALEPGSCVTAAVQSCEPVFVGSLEEMQRRYWRSAEAAGDGGYASAAVLPLIVERAPIAVLEFDFTVPVNFDDEYRALLVSVAQLSAQALDRARLYETAERARSDAEAANRLKDEFLSVVSHELRTPLNSILGWAAILTKGELDAARAARALQAIQDNATRQARLVDELLDFSRIAAGRAGLDLQVLDVSSLLGAVVESVTPMAMAKGVDLQAALHSGTTVRGDVRRLEQVFFNVIGNAVKFTPPGGAVRVQVSADEREVAATVSDTGTGIDATFLPYVFDRFRQAEPSLSRTYGGLGLGLSIARQLVEAHKGTIAAASEGRGRGATFVVRLPRENEATQETGAMPRTPATAQEMPAPHLDGVHVLIVDDEAEAREVMACALAGCGAKVAVAARAVEALEMLKGGTVDVLLADIAMPDLDGYTLMRRVRQSSSARVAGIPAAAVTAHVRDDEKRRALDAGFQLHVAKPIDPARLAHVVHTLAQSRPQPPAGDATQPA